MHTPHPEPVPLALTQAQTTVRLKQNSTIYPVLTLPPEITTEIFIRCLPVQWYHLPSPRDAPLLLLQICSCWRALTLCTPALWKHLDMALHPYPRRMENTERHMTEWISRASLAPLSLGFYETAMSAPVQMGTLVHRYAPRCESLRLGASIHTLSEPPDLGPFPLLRNLRLAYPSGSVNDTQDAVTVRAFTNTPALREVTLGQRSIPSILAIPWHQLTAFTGDSLSVAECLFVFRSCPRLTTCTFLYLVPGFSAVGTHTHSLHDLSISHSAPDILRYIELPTLRNLYLTRPQNMPIDVLQQLLIRCGSSLCRFHYAPTFRYRHSIDVVWFLAMPQLVDLDLSGVGTWFMSALVQALDRKHAPTFLPSLRTMHIECEGYEVGGELVAALASRCTDVSVGLGLLDMILEPLKSFRLVWTEEGGLDLSSMDALSELVRRGMTIHIGPAKENYLKT
ncbi:hypothetical protein DFH08DRAFT_276250 [Mycena albidolilacea]|uniref:F-box domain-containing protein n=1 Tax=Mycena albidolilacea TaxID=1033008 RepID=A0AAD7AQX0_9AGAR|nr:hypothetical protein DFH08DRAFT_276250 [Mycena albidolilacea]